MRLEKACYGWLYDYAPDIMECLDTAAEGAEAAEAAEAAVEELLKVDPPPREEVLQRGGLTPGRRGLWPPPGTSRGGSWGGDWQGQQIVSRSLDQTLCSAADPSSSATSRRTQARSCSTCRDYVTSAGISSAAPIRIARGGASVTRVTRLSNAPSDSDAKLLRTPLSASGVGIRTDRA